MLHNEARELLVESYEKTHNAEEIAKIFGVNKYTVYHMAERKRKTGSVALRTSQRGRKQLLNDEDKQHIRQCIDETPDITLAELRTKLGLKASIQTLSRVVRAMGYRVKKRACRHPNRSVPDVRKERTDWRGSGLEKQADHLVLKWKGYKLIEPPIPARSNFLANMEVPDDADCYGE